MTVKTIRKFNDLEFRKTNFIGKEDHYYEIVRWEQAEDILDCKPYCYTLLHWLRNSEGWDIKFIGNRPFEYAIRNAADEDMSTMKFWAFIEYCQHYVDNEFGFEEKLKWYM